MTPIERLQAVALLTGAEALRSQAAALMALAEAQVNAANALLGAETPTPTEPLTADGLMNGGRLYYGKQKQQVHEHPSQE